MSTTIGQTCATSRQTNGQASTTNTMDDQKSNMSVRRVQQVTGRALRRPMSSIGIASFHYDEILNNISFFEISSQNLSSQNLGNY